MVYYFCIYSLNYLDKKIEIDIFAYLMNFDLFLGQSWNLNKNYLIENFLLEKDYYFHEYYYNYLNHC